MKCYVRDLFSIGDGPHCFLSGCLAVIKYLHGAISGARRKDRLFRVEFEASNLLKCDNVGLVCQQSTVIANTLDIGYHLYGQFLLDKTLDHVSEIQCTTYINMVVERSDDGVSMFRPLSPRVHVGLGEHPLHIEDLDGGVSRPGGAERSVRGESARPAIALVARHVRRLVQRRLRRGRLHVRRELEVEAGPDDLGDARRYGGRLQVAAAAGRRLVLPLRLGIQTRCHHVVQPIARRAHLVDGEHVGELDRGLLVAVVEELRYHESVQQVAVSHDVASHLLDRAAAIPTAPVPKRTRWGADSEWRGRCVHHFGAEFWDVQVRENYGKDTRFSKSLCLFMSPIFDATTGG